MNNLQLISKTLRSDTGMVAMCCTLRKGDQDIIQRVMSLDDYATLIQGATKRKKTNAIFRIGEIPEQMVDGYISNCDGKLGGVFRFPAAFHQFVLAATGNERRRSYFLPMPNMVFSISAVSGTLRKFYCFCYKEWNGQDTVLYSYPFGNVSEDGSVCMGTINSPKNGMIKTFEDLNNIIEESLCGVTNTDYLTDNMVRLACNVTQHTFCDSISNEKEFPHHLLLESPNYHTVEQMMCAFCNEK